MNKTALTSLSTLTALLLLGAAPAWAQPFETRYRERVAQFERENARLSPGARSVVLFGSSSMEGWKNSNRVARYLPNLRGRALNRGISGDGIGIKATTGLYNRIRPSVTGANPTHVFVLNGRNSLGYGAARVATRYREVVQELRRTSPQAVITLISCAPVRGSHAGLKDKIVQLNAELRTIAREEGAFYYDLHSQLVDSQGLLKASLTSDGLHFKDEGYRLLGAEIERIVSSGERPSLPQPAPPAQPATPTSASAGPGASSDARQVAVGGLNLRAGPGREHAVIATLPRGTALDVQARSGDWLQVEAGARRGWLYGAFTEARPPESADAGATNESSTEGRGAFQVTAVRLNVREGPGTEFARIGSLSRGTRVQVLARSGPWWKIRLGERSGWVHSGLLERVPPSDGITDRLRR